MKRLIFSLLLLLFLLPVNAQQLSKHFPCSQLLDTSYDGFMFNLPKQGRFLSNGLPVTREERLDLRCTAVRYISATPIYVYGVAVTTIGTTTSAPADNYWFNNIQGALIVKDGETYVVVDSARMKPYFQKHIDRRWLPRRFFNYEEPIPSTAHGDYLGAILTEYYFETPRLMQDTFFVGLIGPTYSQPAPEFLTTLVDSVPGLYPVQDDLLLLTNQGKVNYAQSGQSYHYYWGGCFPIIKPYEEVEGEIICDTVPNFHLENIRVGYPTFAWDTDYYCREEDLYEVQFAPYHPGTATQDNQWITENTTDSSIRLFAVFDTSIYYQARIRARRHHLCPIHDTLMWGPWSRPILFYSGPTEPDTTSAVADIEALASEVTVAPNPAKGHVVVAAPCDIDAVEVFDLQGRMILRSEPKAREVGLDVSMWSPGAYTVHVYVHGRKVVRRVTVQ